MVRKEAGSSLEQGLKCLIMVAHEPDDCLDYSVSMPQLPRLLVQDLSVCLSSIPRQIGVEGRPAAPALAGAIF